VTVGPGRQIRGPGGETTDRSIERKGYGGPDWQLAHRPQKVTSASSIA
jgi:hypothetical protein